MKGMTTEEIYDEVCASNCQADNRKWIEFKEAIAYFKGVQAQHNVKFNFPAGNSRGR